MQRETNQKKEIKSFALVCSLSEVHHSLSKRVATLWIF